MPQTPTERLLHWRRRTARQRIEVYLDPDVLDQLDDLVANSGAGGRGELIRRLLLAEVRFEQAHDTLVELIRYGPIDSTTLLQLLAPVARAVYFKND